ncbi:hypothetical protein C2S52_005410 [Perilla frutescens var. hirtella]|nr:hypothetical protein C2S51_010269 [Perilla frutescens var. frutescens]KAH6794933.1 hypothetical protein C2S52_005410 [Perilla frutescens var. hirtella]
MSLERKTRGRQRIPIKLIENKDDLLVSFSKRRVGVYKKASELSTLCGVDVGAIIFSPSGIPHSFFTPDFDSVVHGRRSVIDQRPEGSPRSRILELNKRLDEVIEQEEREEQREKQLNGAAVNGGEMWWWEVPGESLDAEQVKEQIEWFQTLKAEIKSRVHKLETNGGSPPPQHGGGSGADHVGGEFFFAPPSLDEYAGGGGTGAHVGDQYLFPPPPPPPHFDMSAGGGSSLTGDHYLFPPPHFDLGHYSFPPASLDLFGGGGIGRDHEQYGYPPSPLGGGINHCWLNGYGYVSREAQGNGEAGPSHRE